MLDILCLYCRTVIESKDCVICDHEDTGKIRCPSCYRDIADDSCDCNVGWSAYGRNE